MVDRQGKTGRAKSLIRRGYKAEPLRRVYIPKKNSTKKRPLGIPVMKDRAIAGITFDGTGSGI